MPDDDLHHARHRDRRPALPDDYLVLWSGLTIGSTGVPSDGPQWIRTCFLDGRPLRCGENGSGTGFGDCKRQFRDAGRAYARA
jgi:hypothetical protein